MNNNIVEIILEISRVSYTPAHFCRKINQTEENKDETPFCTKTDYARMVQCAKCPLASYSLIRLYYAKKYQR